MPIKSLRGIMNIIKYDGNIHGMFVASVTRKGFSLVLIFTEEKQTVDPSLRYNI